MIAFHLDLRPSITLRMSPMNSFGMMDSVLALSMAVLVLEIDRGTVLGARYGDISNVVEIERMQRHRGWF